MAVCVDGEAQLASAIEADDPIDAGARAEQDRGDCRRMAPTGTRQEYVQGPEVAITRTAQRSEQLLLRLWRYVE